MTHPLAGFAILDGTPPDALAAAAAVLHQRGYAAGETIFDFEEAATEVLFVQSGIVRIIARTPGGREFVYRDLEAGQVIGEIAAIDGAPRSASAAAVIPTRVLALSNAAFLGLVSASPALSLTLLRMLTARVRELSIRLVEQSAFTVRQRVAAELLRMARPRRGADGLAVSPPPQQHVLAARIGARREAVSRELAAMRREGLVSLQRGALVLIAPDALRELSRAELGV
ncbi:Crp/Fnr family transcriptional regulator [Elioraea sp.]|uniref:Crp/Fnr family transcriptional regulator n=1 Tax=Elioraea sp. TaxID=2185103 RepID=UPI0025C4F629|nr:Crp/Fnr family transcriptional regulator [Elioraea sp.]